MKNFIAILMLTIVLLSACKQATDKTETLKISEVTDPLPSWNTGPTKTAIIEFVNKVINKKAATYVPPEDRIATFDNDGTLWCEQPVVELEFVVHQIKKMAAKHPEWKEKQPYKSVLEDDEQYLANDVLNNQGKALATLFASTHSGITLKQFKTNVKAFLNASTHAKYGKKYTETVYQPMLELLHYLRNNDFKTYICSGGENDFIRVFAHDVYGIVPENVIGSFAMNTFEQVDGQWEIVKETHNFFMNDKETKPASIEQRIGRIPIFVAGNVRGGGDIAQLTYSQTNTLPNFQLLIHHDDDIREFAYFEKDSASLNAAKERNWHVVSMKHDWLKIFPFENITNEE